MGGGGRQTTLFGVWVEDGALGWEAVVGAIGRCASSTSGASKR